MLWLTLSDAIGIVYCSVDQLWGWNSELRDREGITRREGNFGKELKYCTTLEGVIVREIYRFAEADKLHPSCMERAISIYFNNSIRSASSVNSIIC